MTSSLSGATGYGGLGKGKTPRGYESGSLQNFSPEQQQLFSQLFSNVGQGSFLSKLAGGDQGTFDQVEAPALKQFAGLQGNLASRFSGMGSGARRSSGFQNASSSAASDFAQQLQSNRIGLQSQALRDLMGMSESLLGQRPFENYLVPKKKSFWEELGLGLSGGVGSGIGRGLTGGF